MRDFALIFRHAWELARKGAETFGGSARDYFRESLLLAYNQLKRNVTATHPAFAGFFYVCKTRTRQSLCKKNVKTHLTKYKHISS